MVCGQGGLSGLSRGGITFGGVGIQGQPDGYSVISIFEGSFTEEVTGVENYIFEGGLKFSASKASENFNITASAFQREEYRSSSPSTQEYQKLEGKLKHNSTGE